MNANEDAAGVAAEESRGLRALRAYSERLLEKGPAHFTVPGLADTVTGADLAVYVWPSSERERVAIMAAREHGDDALLAETVVQRARDAAGDPLFGPDDATFLVKLRDAGLLDRIVAGINEAAPMTTVEDAKGN